MLPTATSQTRRRKRKHLAFQQMEVAIPALVNVVPGGKGMGPWHSTISQLLAGVAFVDNLKSIQSESGTIMLFSSTPLKIIPTDRENIFYNFVMFATQIPSIGQKQFFQAAAQKSACTHMQKIQNDSLKD